MADRKQARVTVHTYTLLRIPGIMNVWTQGVRGRWYLYVYTPRRSWEWRVR